MKSRTLPKCLTDCLVPNDSVSTIKAAAELIVEEMKAIPGGDRQDYRIDANLELGYVLIVGRGQ